MPEPLDPLKTPIDPPVADPENQDIDPATGKPKKQVAKTVEELQAELALESKRRKDFQAKADRLESHLQRLNPVLAALDQNPEVVDRLMRPQSAAPADEMPKPPDKPEHYDDIAAYNDPTSESFKYRKSKEKYQDAKLEWVDRREQQREREKQAAREAAVRQQQMQETMGVTQAKLVSEMGFKPEEATHFVAWMSDDKNVTLENLVAFYRAVHKPAAPAKGGRPANYGPTPAAVAGGGGHQEVDENQAFNESIQRNNPTSKKQLFPRTAGAQRR